MFLNQYANNINKKDEKEELKLDKSIQFWKEALFEKAIRIFVWDGLPFPQKEIEIRLLLNGFCGFLKDAQAGIMVATGSMSGVTHYYDEFTQFTYAAPKAFGGTKKIDSECVIINNTALRNPLYPLIFRYACLLAHTDISIKCALINMRYTDLFSTDDESTAENVRAVREKIYNGDYDCIVDKSIISSLDNKANSATGNMTVKDALEVKTELLKSFYNEIGVRYVRDKKERMISDEIENDEQMLLLNINDMKYQREKACKKINELFGLNVSVKLSPEFEIIEKEGMHDDNC